MKNKLSSHWIKKFWHIALLTSLTLLFNVAFITTGKAQAMYIVLIFGDKIATDNFHLTIDGGLNITGMPGLDHTNKLIGLYYGMGIYMKLNDKWVFMPEFKPLSQRGARNVQPLTFYPDVTDPKYKFRLNYIDFPFLFQRKLSPRIYVSAGPQISFLIGGKQITTGTSATAGTNVKISEDIMDSFNRLYYSIPLEFGYILPKIIPGKNIEFKARYCIGLSEAIADKSYGSSKYSMIQVMLSLPFVKKVSTSKGI
jgi:hypothetical protein